MVIFFLSSDRNTAKYCRKCVGRNSAENYGHYNGRKLFRSHTSKSLTSTMGLLLSLSVMVAMGRVLGDEEDEVAHSSDSSV